MFGPDFGRSNSVREDEGLPEVCDVVVLCDFDTTEVPGCR